MLFKISVPGGVVDINNDFNNNKNDKNKNNNDDNDNNKNNVKIKTKIFNQTNC